MQKSLEEEKNEHEKVLKSVREDPYPPINPAVLLKACLYFYLKEGWSENCQRILDWLSYLGKLGKKGGETKS